MSTLAETVGTIRKPWQWIVVGGTVLAIWAALALPALHRSTTSIGQQTATSSVERFHPAPAMISAYPNADAPASADMAVPAKNHTPDVGNGKRKIIRTTSLEMVVQRPSEIAEKINALIDDMGGYLVSSDDGGPNATSATLVVRVPASRFEEARAQIRKLGLRVESEKVDAQDVTRQYVDRDASIRNLKAEEAQFLTILKQAATVKDMLAVSEHLSEVRGQIEQEQAEFNALSQQIDTVAISISLRTESEAQVFGLNWRPGHQLKLALHDGLDSIANYATAMTMMLFYLPAVLLWVGTILIAAIGSWRMVQWVGKRWLARKPSASRAQG